VTILLAKQANGEIKKEKKRKEKKRKEKKKGLDFDSR
jgi:hypothetical protein